MKTYTRFHMRRFSFLSLGKLNTFCSRMSRILVEAYSTLGESFDKFEQNFQDLVKPLSLVPELVAASSVGGWLPYRPPSSPPALGSARELNYLAERASGPLCRENTRPALQPSEASQEPLGQYQAGYRGSSFSSTDFSSQPCQIIRDLAYVCKVNFLALVGLSLVWILFFGQPSKLLEIPAGVYQGFKCGWNSEVKNPWTCDE